MKKNCVILKWNPGISSYNFIDFLADIGNEEYASDWSIHEHGQVKAGDRFFMLKVGCGTCGIVASGEITGNPVPGGDWSGRGRKVYYADYLCDFMVNPATLPILESSTLEDNIPGFDWHGGHSGVILDEERAEILERLFMKYLQEHSAFFADRFDLMEQCDLFNDQLYIEKELFAGIKGA